MMKQNLFTNNDLDNNNLLESINENKDNNLQSLELKELENALIDLNIEEIGKEENNDDIKKNELDKKDSQKDSNLKKFNFIRVNNLLQRRPFLLNSTILRRNPNNVAEWLKRIELMKDKNDFKLIKIYMKRV
jgi:pre-mRNA-splicing factor SYF1